MKTTFGLIGPYLQLEYNPIPDLYIIPGLRYDYYSGTALQGVDSARALGLPEN